MTEDEVKEFKEWFSTTNFIISYYDGDQYASVEFDDIPEIIDAYNEYKRRQEKRSTLLKEKERRIARSCEFCGSNPDDICSIKCAHCMPF